MASPPAKRQRRAVIADSDDEDSEAASPNATKGNLSINKKKSSPPKKRKPAVKTKPVSSALSKNGRTKVTSTAGSNITKKSTLYSFFGNAAQSSSQNTIRPNSPRPATPAQDLDDLIEDDLSDSVASQNASQSRRRTSRHLSNDVAVEPTAVTRSKQFASVRPKDVLDQKPSIEDSKGSIAWIDAFPPESLEELVVHKRKVSDVHKWLDNVINGRDRHRLLILKGPAGSGKTTTLRLLARELNSKIVEWENPVGAVYDNTGFVSLAAQFEEFLNRSHSFHGLDFSSTDGTHKLASSTSSQSRMMVLIEEFPNTFSRGSAALMNFRDSIQRYLAITSSPTGTRISDQSITPVVLIISETNISTSTDYSDSFTVNKLLGPQILQHPCVAVIEFNSVAPTLLSKALTTIVKKQNQLLKTRWSPSTDLIKKVSQSGDIRSSINSLQMMYLFEQDQSNSVPDTKSFKNPKKRGASASAQTSNSNVAFRDDIVDLFHAVGKIIYNKRGEPESEQPTQPPAHLRHHWRPKVSEVHIEKLLDGIGTDIDTFISTLHENYVLSCYGEDFTDTLDDCILNLSDADILLSAGSESTGSRPTIRASSSQIQAEYAFQVSSRGLLFSLPYPVERGKTMSSALKLGRDPFKMVFPASLKLWRQVADNESLIDDWIQYIYSSREAGPCSTLSKSDMVTQYLPFAARVLPNLTFNPVSRRERDSTSANLDGDEDIHTTSVLPTSSLVLPLPPSVDQKMNNFGIGAERTLSSNVQQLVLSDDDIEDD